MNFAAAVNEMLKGKKVRCLSWFPKSTTAFITIEDNLLYYYSYDKATRNKAMGVIEDQFVAKTDWEVFEPKTANQIKAEELETQAKKLLEQATDLRKSL